MAAARKLTPDEAKAAYAQLRQEAEFLGVPDNILTIAADLAGASNEYAVDLLRKAIGDARKGVDHAEVFKRMNEELWTEYQTIRAELDPLLAAYNEEHKTRLVTDESGALVIRRRPVGQAINPRPEAKTNAADVLNLAAYLVKKHGGELEVTADIKGDDGTVTETVTGSLRADGSVLDDKSNVTLPSMSVWKYSHMPRGNWMKQVKVTIGDEKQSVESLLQTALTERWFEHTDDPDDEAPVSSDIQPVAAAVSPNGTSDGAGARVPRRKR